MQPECKFTPLEFETDDDASEDQIAECKFTPLEFETPNSKAAML